MPPSQDDFVFFWKPGSAHGWASQWYHSPFTARIELHIAPNTDIDSEHEYEFPTAEHWMMACKALVFGDKDVFQRVLEAGADDMAAVKALGREVHNFDDKVWKQVREQVVLAGSLHKFRQSDDLGRLLLATGEKNIIEASPRIGFGVLVWRDAGTPGEGQMGAQSAWKSVDEHERHSEGRTTGMSIAQHILYVRYTHGCKLHVVETALRL